MKRKENYRVEKLDFLRKLVKASASAARQKNTIHFFAEADVSVPLSILERYSIEHGIKISFTGFLVKSFANVIEKYPSFNSFISGNKHIIINDIIISILVERNIGTSHVPEPMIIKNISNKTVVEINNEIREAQDGARRSEEIGSLNDFRAIKYIPGFLLKTFVKLADRNIKMGIKYGKLAITSVGMFSKNPIWMIPHGSSTVLLSVGSIIHKPVCPDGAPAARHLCLTVSFDHDIIDGAPASRFMDDLIEEIKKGNCLLELVP